jgi:hypothetical protein
MRARHRCRGEFVELSFFFNIFGRLGLLIGHEYCLFNCKYVPSFGFGVGGRDRSWDGFALLASVIPIDEIILVLRALAGFSHLAVSLSSAQIPGEGPKQVRRSLAASLVIQQTDSYKICRDKRTNLSLARLRARETLKLRILYPGLFRGWILRWQ